MKGFGKIALVFSLVGGLMAYFIIPVQFSRKRALSPADKAEYALTVNYYQRHCGPVLPEIEERAKAYARESGEDVWAAYDAHVAKSRAGDWLPGLVPLHSRTLVQIRSRGSIQEPGGACGEARGRGVVA